MYFSQIQVQHSTVVCPHICIRLTRKKEEATCALIYDGILYL